MIIVLPITVTDSVASTARKYAIGDDAYIKNKKATIEVAG